MPRRKFKCRLMYDVGNPNWAWYFIFYTSLKQKSWGLINMMKIGTISKQEWSIDSEWCIAETNDPSKSLILFISSSCISLNELNNFSLKNLSPFCQKAIWISSQKIWLNSYHMLSYQFKFYIWIINGRNKTIL